MRYRFRLEQLLKFRKASEDQRRIEMALLREKQFEEEEKLFHIRESQRDYLGQLQDKQSWSAERFSYLDSLSWDAINRKRAIQRLNSEIADAKDRLISAFRARRVVEKLRERHLLNYKQYVLKEERKYLDEISTTRFAKKDI